VGPPNTIKPASCQAIYFYFLFDVWDYIGYNYSWSQLHLAGPKNGKVKVITAGRSLA